MLRDIYAIPEEESRYDSSLIELTNPFDQIIQQIDCLLFTKKGDVVLNPYFGCNLEEYLFETSFNAEEVENEIMDQINYYVINPYNYSISVDVSFLKWDFNVGMMVDVSIEGLKIASYLA